MGNKHRLKLAAVLGLTVPFLAFGLVWAVGTEGTAATNPSDAMKQRMQQAVRDQQEKLRMQKAAEMRDANKDVDRGAINVRTGETGERTRDMRIKALGMLMQAQVHRAQKALERMGDIMDRLNARRDKMAESDADLDEVDALIRKAEGLQTEAQRKLDKAKADYAALEGSEQPRLAVQTFMASMRDLKKTLIGLHGAMKETIRAMRAALPKPDGPAGGSAEREGE